MNTKESKITTQVNPSDESREVDEVVDTVKSMPSSQQQQTIAKLEMYSGPIPHPDILRQYDEIDPGAGKLIIENGVAEAKHRRDIENHLLETDKKVRHRRDWMGFCISILGMVIGGLLTYMDHYIVGSIFSGVMLLGMVGLFLGNGTRKTGDKAEEEFE